MCAVLVFVVFAMFPSLTAFTTSADRTLYFKLPIEGTEFHWEFLDREAFLAGELTLRIINDGRDETLVVFRDGKIHEGWEMIGDERRGGRFYFGLSTNNRFRTRADDSLIVTLTAKQDLLGQGPDTEGVLPAGVWQMSGSYSSIYGGRWNPLDLFRRGRPPIAFMECWTGVWPITITKREGWMGKRQPDGESDSRGFYVKRGTNGRPCGSHI